MNPDTTHDTDGQFLFFLARKTERKDFNLTGSVEGVGAEQDAESRLEIESGAAAVGATILDAFGELERVGPRVQDFFRRREHVARPQFKGRVLGAAVGRLGRLGLGQSVQLGQQQEQSYRQTCTRHPGMLRFRCGGGGDTAGWMENYGGQTDLAWWVRCS